MRRLALCVSLAGCNQVFDLSPTQLATEMMPTTCPPVGTPPRFETIVRQGIREDCTGYTESADTNMALASCRAGAELPAVAYGPAGGPLTAITLTTPGDSFSMTPLLAPEGDEILWSANNAGQVRLATFRLVGDTWQFAGYDAMGSGLPIGAPSPPSRGPKRHVVYYGNAQLHEAAQDDAGTWNEVGPPYDIPVNANRPYLSPDGLRLVTSVRQSTGEHYVVYADRPSIDDRFGALTMLDAVPPTQDTFVTEDCTRVYFSGLANVLFEEQSR